MRNSIKILTNLTENLTGIRSGFCPVSSRTSEIELVIEHPNGKSAQIFWDFYELETYIDHYYDSLKIRSKLGIYYWIEQEKECPGKGNERKAEMRCRSRVASLNGFSVLYNDDNRKQRDVKGILTTLRVPRIALDGFLNNKIFMYKNLIDLIPVDLEAATGLDLLKKNSQLEPIFVFNDHLDKYLYRIVYIDKENEINNQMIQYANYKIDSNQLSFFKVSIEEFIILTAIGK